MKLINLAMEEMVIIVAIVLLLLFCLVLSMN